MIPLRLEVANFLSYREATTLDFASIHLACIAGANGAGKSSLLDAITWALFGQSRSRSDDDLVNRIAAARGEEARVEFHFALEGTTYRVLRRKQVGKVTRVEFQVATGNGEWKALSEGKVRETQAAIEALLNMNFDTFVNASFLLQGKADEFTTKTPNQRKEILADLLGVDRWEIYKEAAMARRKDAERQLLLLDAQLGDIEQELGEEPERRAALSAAQESLERISAHLAAQEMLLEQLRRTDLAIKQQHQMVKNLADNLVRTRSELERLQQSHTERTKEQEALLAVLDQAQEIEQRFAEWQAAEEDLQLWQEKAEGFGAIQEAKRPFELAIEGERSRLEQRLVELEGQAQRIAQMRQEREQLVKSLADHRERLTDLRAELDKLRQAEQEWHEAKSKLQAIESDRRLIRQRIEQFERDHKHVTNLMAEQSEVELNLAEARHATAELETLLVELNDKAQRLSATKNELDLRRTEQTSLKENMQAIRERLDRLQEQAGGACPLCGQPLSQEHRARVVEELETEGRNLGDRFRQNQARLAELGEEIALLGEKVSQKEGLDREHRAKQQRLASAEARLQEIERAVEGWKTTGELELARLQAQLADETAVEAQQAIIDGLAPVAKRVLEIDEQRQQAERQIATEEARLGHIDQALAEWDMAEGGPAQELETAARKLDSAAFAEEARFELTRLEARAADVGYDPAAHAEAKGHLETLAGARERYEELRQARAAAKPLNQAVADLEKRLAEATQHVEELATQHEGARAALEDLSRDQGDLTAMEREVARLREEEIAAHRRVAMTQQMVDVLEALRRQKGQAAAERSELSQHIQRLKLLEKACSREGVQALLIEQALPEIEDDANDLLDRLTGGQMRVTFDTQRKLKTSDRLAETLDIRIVDTVGERPYENFSGGEQFRINFAIRLALSRILTKRAGARLQTLVIDEGFGSQDPIGRQRLVEAINIVKSDYERILVITHVEELRDAFPVRIEVEKGASGSVITVV
ncbi:MAG: AAA family ATPase [Candidatus Promineifilaceae bacterium]